MSVYLLSILRNHRKSACITVGTTLALTKIRYTNVNFFIITPHKNHMHTLINAHYTYTIQLIKANTFLQMQTREEQVLHKIATDGNTTTNRLQANKNKAEVIPE